ncbi:MAG: glycosyltransferase [bacterium]|nr:glycosyltransferase [bacterium]
MVIYLIMLKGEDILCISTADWDNIGGWTNKQHIMSRLSKANRILYIESLGLRQPTIKKKDVLRILKRIKDWFKGPRRINETLMVYSPIILPLHKIKIIRGINHLILLLTLKLLLKRLGFKNPILWTYSPASFSLIERLNEKLVVYHCVDELSATPRIPISVLKMEEELLKKADLVFATAKLLYERKKVFNPNTFYMPNVADVTHFMKDLPIPEDIAVIKHPIIGFIGTLVAYKLDLELIKYIASTHHEWSIVLIGEIAEGEDKDKIEELKNIPSIFMLGGRRYEVLPGYVKAFDVCLLPNKINEYTQNMFPMKFFEYLATGKPIVLTELLAVSEYRNLCYIAKNKEEFVQYIEQALLENDVQLSKRRIEVAKENTWEVRINQMSGLIEEKLLSW